MKHPLRQLVSTIVAASFAAGLVFAAPAFADPASGTSTTVEMPMPSPGQSGAGGDSAYQSPQVSVSVQDGSGGVDRDGTTGIVDSDGTNGRITGPQVTATPRESGRRVVGLQQTLEYVVERDQPDDLAGGRDGAQVTALHPHDPQRLIHRDRDIKGHRGSHQIDGAGLRWCLETVTDMHNTVDAAVAAN
jgi:hypothetical protein